MAALAAQPEDIRKIFQPYKEDFIKSSWYPDHAATIRQNNPREAHFLFPPPPQTAWQRRLERISRSEPLWTWCGQPPLPDLYLCRHYLRQAVGSLRAGDLKSAVKYCGVYSHVIADAIEPGHAVFDWALDIFVPSGVYHPAKRILTNKECLRGPASIPGYTPRLLGDTLERAEMAAMNDLIAGSRFGASLAAPMEQALYAGRIKDARDYSSRAQSESARKTADFMHTVFCLADAGRKAAGAQYDLCALPYVLAEVSCLCRFRPLVDVLMDPANFARPCRGPYLLKTRPLTLRARADGRDERVHGLCVIPPKFAEPARVEYVIAPGAFRKFTARVGLNPGLDKLPFLSAAFSVHGDRGELARAVVRAGTPAVRLAADLRRSHSLRLEMQFRGGLSDSERQKLKGLTSALHGIWGEPILE